MKQIYHADTSAMRLLSMTCLLLAGLLCLAAIVLLQRLPILMWTMVGIFAAIGILGSFLLLPLYFNKLQMEVTNSQIFLKTGIIFRRERSVQFQSIQFVQVITGPRDGAGGWNFITLYLYGGRLFLPFLRQTDRQALTQLLQEKGVYHAP